MQLKLDRRPRMLLFSNTLRYPYDIFRTLQSVIYKYPNDHATHVVSVDTLDFGLVESSASSSVPNSSESLSGPTVRLERLICVRQSAPKWVAKVRGLFVACEMPRRLCDDELKLVATCRGQICGGSLDNYVREVTFITPPVPSSSSSSETSSPGPTTTSFPAVLQASTNLSIRNVVTCDERISYTADVEAPKAASIFSQKAFIRAQGKFHEGEVMSWLGHKIEKSSWERCVFFVLHLCS